MSDLFVIGDCLVACDAGTMLGYFAEAVGSIGQADKCRTACRPKHRKDHRDAVSHELSDYCGLGVPLSVVRRVYDWTRRHDYRLELLATALLLSGEGVAECDLWSRVLRYHRDLETNPVGFSGIIGGVQRRVGCSSDCLLANVVKPCDTTEEQEDAERVVALVVALLGTLGEQLAAGKSVEDAAVAADCSPRTAYRKIEQCRALLTGS